MNTQTQGLALLRQKAEAVGLTRVFRKRIAGLKDTLI